MTGDTQTLPDFGDPPVVEVALAVQFRTLHRLRAPVLAKWESMRRVLPIWEEKPPLPVQQEVFGIPQLPTITLRLPDDAAPVRAWFLNDDRSDILQVQPDAIVRNWVKTGNEPYPRYPTLRAEFERLFVDFCSFLSREQVGDLHATQCEVTYVNLVDLGERNLADVVHGWTGETSDGFLGPPERAEIFTHYRIEADGKPVGRLHVEARTVDLRGAPKLRLSLSARGAPRSSDLAGVLSWFDLGREWIVRGFTSYTSPKMHSEWKRRT